MAAFDIDTIKSLIGSVKTAKLVSLDKSTDSVTLQFNPEKDSLSLRRQIHWGFEGETNWPDDPWGGPANWKGADPDILEFTTLLDETTGGAKAWAAAAGKSALAARFVAGTDMSLDMLSKNRLVAVSGMDAAVGLADVAAEDLLRKLDKGSVHEMLRKFYWLTTPDAQTGARMRPSIVKFEWGDFDFVGVIEEMTVDYLVVTSEGYPRRAKVDLTLKGRAFSRISTPEAFLNPTWTGRSSLL